MEVKEGYKKTEVGVIPNDWKIEQLDTVSLITMGQSPLGNSYNKSEDGIPLINGPTEFTDKHPVEIQWTNKPTKFCKKGDILICVRGSSTGRINISNNLYCIGRGIAAIRAKEVIDNNYLEHQVCYVIKDVLTLTNGSTFPNLDGKTLKSINLSFPSSKPEQTYIANALSDTDTLINSLEKLIAKKQAIKQGTMQLLLTGKKRLPGFSGEWEVKKLGDCLEKSPQYGLNASAVPYNFNLPTYIRITDISEDGDFISEGKASVNHPYSHNYYLDKDDIVFARTGASVGKTYLFNGKGEKLVFAGFLIRVKVNRAVLSPYFLKYYTQSKPYWRWVLAQSTRSGQPGLNGNDFKELPIKIPSIKEQKEIVNALIEIDEEIIALKQKLSKHRQIKQGMMQSLLTGKIRLV